MKQLGGTPVEESQVMAAETAASSFAGFHNKADLYSTACWISCYHQEIFKRLEDTLVRLLDCETVSRKDASALVPQLCVYLD